MIIGIVGSRRRNSLQDELELHRKLFEIAVKHDISTDDLTIVTGDCDEGGDKFARRLAKDGKDAGIKLDEKKIKHPQTGEELDFKDHVYFNYYTMTSIFYRRNEEIAKEPLDYLIALVAPDRTGGTENTIKHFKRLHKDWKEKLIIL